MGRPEGLGYLKSHEWARIEGDIAWIGLTDYALEQLGDLIFLDLPTVGQDIMQNEPFGDIESVKTVSDLYAPLTGEVLERNERLSVMEHLATLKDDAFGEGWMLKIRMENSKEAENLLDGAAYESAIAELEAES